MARTANASCRGALRGWVLLLPLALAGCQQAQTRGQMADEDNRPEIFKEIPTVGDVTEISGAVPLQVSGVALVTGLEGTGGGPPRDFYTKMLEDELRKQRVERVKELLESPDNAVVLVTALIPPGARKGDPIDIEVSLPHGSKVTSLRGGYLQPCSLRTHDTKKGINPGYEGADALLPGHVLARARGPLLVGFSDEEGGVRLTRARVWHGGVFLSDRPFFLTLKADQKFTRVANAVAGRINQLFPSDAARQQRVMENRDLLVLDEVTSSLNQQFKPAPLARQETAKAVAKNVINLRVPYNYRHNPERYLRVAMRIPLREQAEGYARYRQELRRLLLAPEHTMAAAVRLEALGKESIPALKEGLKHSHPLVRFCSAEALAYLDSQAGVEELAALGERYEALRAYCLTALATLEEGACQLRLIELLGCSNAEMRYGAFKALRMQDEPCDAVAGEVLNESFWLHRAAPRSSPLIHIATSQRAEIVIFGDEARAVPPFRIPAGEFVVSADRGDDRCTVSRFVRRGKDSRVGTKQCGLRLQDVLRAMADLGGHYPDAVELIRQADHARVLTSPVVVDATPITVPMEDLALEGRELKWLAEAGGERPAGRVHPLAPDRDVAGTEPGERPAREFEQE